jgi:hypothetical protein
MGQQSRRTDRKERVDRTGSACALARTFRRPRRNASNLTCRVGVTAIGKVRDGEGAIASGRGARAPQLDYALSVFTSS